MTAEESAKFEARVETRSASVDNVDFGQRLVTVIIAPYEQPAEVFYRQEIWNEVFSRSAWQGIETRQKRIPAVAALQIPDQNHNGFIVGRVIEADPNRPEGLIGEVKISRTDRGDETLQLAADDALSVSAGFLVKDRRRDEVLDRRTKTRRINRAFLDHLAFVGQPAYPGARILAMRGEGNIAESELPRLVTPRIDEFTNDPIFQWVADRAR